MSGHDLAARFALLKILVGELTTAKRVADCEIRDGWQPKDRLSAALPDGTVVGTVTLASGKATAKLADEDAYRTWVEKAHPDQMETVTVVRVRPDFTDRLMSAARKLGEPVDAETGEIVPGITVESGEPYPMVKLGPDARDAVAAAWADGSLRDLLAGLLAIEGGA